MKHRSDDEDWVMVMGAVNLKAHPTNCTASTAMEKTKIQKILRDAQTNLTKIEFPASSPDGRTKNNGEKKPQT